MLARAVRPRWTSPPTKGLAGQILARLGSKGIPVDIVFEQGPEVLHLVAGQVESELGDDRSIPGDVLERRRRRLLPE